MELIYLYIEEFRDVIKNWKIAFSPEYKITKTDNYIEVEKLENKSLEGFFGRNILNVNAIVGPNGSGKTTLCEYLFSYALGNMSSKTIFIIKDPDGLKLYYNGEMGSVSWTEDSIPIKFSPSDERLDLGLVYFSSAIGSREFHSYSGVKISQNISNSLLIANPEDNDLFKTDDKYTKYRYSDLAKQVRFLSETNTEFGIDINEVWFYFNKGGIGSQDQLFEGSNLEEYIYRIIVPEYDQIQNTKRWVLGRRDIMDGNAKVMLLMLCEFWKMSNYTDLVPFLKEVLSCNSWEELVDVLNHRKENDEKLLSIYNYYKYLQKEKDSFGSFSVSIFLNGSVINLIEQLQFNLKRPKVLDFMEIYSATPTEDYWGVEWRASAGQYAALSLFSRIWYLNDKFEKLKSKTILLILDEAETYLHPDWARKWNKQIFDFLKKDFPEFKFQIVFTTHSPFTLSDIPDTNVIYLGEGAAKLEPKKTFAENINVLLSDSFYVKGAFIGEFAKKKVQELVRYLETGRCDDPYINSRERAIQVVEMIGEPVISWHLKELLSKKGDL